MARHSRANPATSQKKKGQPEGCPSCDQLLHAGFHTAAGLHSAALHEQFCPVRVEEDEETSDKDRDDETDDVEPRDRDLAEDLINNLQDRVEDQSAYPAHIGLRVESGDHHAGAECNARYRCRDAGPGVEWEKAGADEAQT